MKPTKTKRTKTTKSAYKQGIYKPEQPTKYTGNYPIIYRSGLELSFFRWCDRNKKILEWSSESVVLPYISPKDGKTHRYFVDGRIKLETSKGIKDYLIEIKPYKQTLPPTKHGNKKRSTILYESIQYAVNNSKWSSAKEWCKKNNHEFMILTEKDLR